MHLDPIHKVLHDNPDYFSNIVDFLHPPTVHTVAVLPKDCRSLFRDADTFAKQFMLLDHKWMKHLFLASKGSQVDY